MIEEINRANAAAVFGEIFQLLDRQRDGSSEYKISLPAELHSYLSGIYKMPAFINGGLSIPSNMNIVATMNSSDQGVSIIDSAFKRRWNFEYLPIDIGSAVHKDAIIQYGSKDVKWGKFITALNEKLKNMRIDEDRLIGPYFIRPEEVTSKCAVDKLLLYLWDDVLKHRREQFFNSSIRTFADLSYKFSIDDVMNLSDLTDDNLQEYSEPIFENDEDEEQS